jgi:hypothetical protein
MKDDCLEEICEEGNWTRKLEKTATKTWRITWRILADFSRL